MRNYEYRCKDNSLLTPLFKRVMVTPLIPFIPWGLPANIITIVSNLFMYIALYLALNRDFLGQWTFLMIPVLLLLYLIGDHLDGAQAKRTGTGSALGEFCDHYLDAFNNGILLCILFLIFGITNSLLIVVVLVFSYLGHYAVFYEQFKTGWLTFEKMGSLEAVWLAIILILFSYFPPVYDLLQLEVLGYSIIEIFFAASALGALVTYAKTVARTPNVTYSMWLFVVLLMVVGIFSAFLFSPLLCVLIVTLYASLHIGKVMQGHLIDGVEHSPGVFTAFFLAISYFSTYFDAYNTALIVIIYLSLNILLLIYRTFVALSSYWVWVNPRKS